MVEAEVGDQAVDPGLEGALVPEAPQGPVDSEERLLVDITRLLLRPHDPQGQPQDVAVVPADQLLESGDVAPLGLADEPAFVC